MQKITLKNNWWTEKRKEVKEKLLKSFNHRSIMQTTDIEKIVISSCVGGGQTNSEQHLINTQESVSRISKGQKPMVTKARKSILNFKIRKGMNIGCKLTLRKQKVWDFLFELININLPAVSNLKGFSKKKFDKRGNYNLGINDLSIFPSVPFDLTFKNQGIQITVVFKSNSSKENESFLECLGFPFSRESNKSNLIV